MGDTTIEAIKPSEGKHQVRIVRNYDVLADDNSNKLVPVNFSDYVESGTKFTLPSAPAFAYYTFDGYYIDGVKYTASTITIDKDTDIVALYTRNDDASCAINATDINNSSVGSDSYKYNDKVELSGGSGTYAWVEEIDSTHYRPFFIGANVSFFASESTTLKAVSKDEFDAFGFSLPAINMRKDGAIVSGTKVIFNGQVVATDMDSVQEYGVLVGVATENGSITADDLIVENSGTHEDYKILRAKSTRPIGDANQFAIGVNGLSTKTYIYRGYLIYKQGDDLVTVYTDVK